MNAKTVIECLKNVDRTGKLDASGADVFFQTPQGLMEIKRFHYEWNEGKCVRIILSN